MSTLYVLFVSVSHTSRLFHKAAPQISDTATTPLSCFFSAKTLIRLNRPAMRNMVPPPSPIKARMGVGGRSSSITHTHQKEKKTKMQQPWGIWTRCVYSCLFVVCCLSLMLPESRVMSFIFCVEATWHLMAAQTCVQWKVLAETEMIGFISHQLCHMISDAFSRPRATSVLWERIPERRHLSEICRWSICPCVFWPFLLLFSPWRLLEDLLCFLIS